MGINRGRDYTVVAGKIVDKSILGEGGESADHQPGAFYFIPGGPFDLAPDVTAGLTGIATATSQALFRQYWPYAMRVRSISIEVVAAQPAALMSVGLYDRNGNRLGWSGQIDASAIGIKTQVDEEFSIPAAGFYWVSWMNTNVTATVRSPSDPDYFLVDPIRNAGRAQKVEKGGVSAVAIPPAVIDLSTYAAIVRNPPFIKFQS